MSEDKQLFLAIYVDNLLIFGADISQLEKIQNDLSDCFKMTNLGNVSHYFEMEVGVEVKKIIKVTQVTYIKKVLKCFGMQDCQPASISIDPGVAFLFLSYDQKAGHDAIVWYQSAIGSLIWPAVHTRPNISYAVGVLSKYCSNPGSTHIELVKRIFSYILRIINIGLTFKAESPDDLVGYCDSDWAGLVDKKKSTGGYIWMLSGCSISHQSKQQLIVALLSCKAEYIAIVEAGKKVL